MKPNQLSKNDYIGVISLSGLLKEKNKNDIEESILNAKKINLNVKLGNYIYENKEQRQEDKNKNKIIDLNKMLDDNDVKIIMSSKGGSDSIELLDKINYNKIKNTKKIFIGLSDLTIILNAIYKKTGLITFHHCIFKSFLKGDVNYNKKAFCDMFFNSKKEYKFKQNFKTINKGIAQGILLGGNLISFNKLIGTDYLPNAKEIIYFFEECDEVSKEHVNNIIDNMIRNNLFKNCNGIILGNYSIDNDYFEQVFKDKFANIPMIKCCDFGHTKCNMVIPVGAKIQFNANNGTIKILDNV